MLAALIFATFLLQYLISSKSSHTLVAQLKLWVASIRAVKWLGSLLATLEVMNNFQTKVCAWPILCCSGKHSFLQTLLSIPFLVEIKFLLFSIFLPQDKLFLQFLTFSFVTNHHPLNFYPFFLSIPPRKAWYPSFFFDLFDSVMLIH